MIAKGIFEEWYGELQSLIRVVETALFISLLNAGRDEMYAFETRHELGASLDRPYGSLVKDSHLTGLTADEKSPEWASGQKWYEGRRR